MNNTLLTCRLGGQQVEWLERNSMHDISQHVLVEDLMATTALHRALTYVVIDVFYGVSTPAGSRLLRHTYWAACWREKLGGVDIAERYYSAPP